MPLCPCFEIFPNLANRAFEPFLTVAFAVCFGVPPLFPEPPLPLLYFLPMVAACVLLLQSQCLSAASGFSDAQNF
jgi:hypothetical protein